MAHAKTGNLFEYVFIGNVTKNQSEDTIKLKNFQ